MNVKEKRLSLYDYLLILGFSSLLVGIVLFIYCFYAQIPLLYVQIMGNPLFYLILGLGLLGSALFFKVDEVIDNATD